MRKAKVEVLKKKSKWYWRIKSANNGKILCHSEQYQSESNAKRGSNAIIDIIKNSLIDG